MILFLHLFFFWYFFCSFFTANINETIDSFMLSFILYQIFFPSKIAQVFSVRNEKWKIFNAQANFFSKRHLLPLLPRLPYPTLICPIQRSFALSNVRLPILLFFSVLRQKNIIGEFSILGPITWFHYVELWATWSARMTVTGQSKANKSKTIWSSINRKKLESSNCFCLVTDFQYFCSFFISFMPKYSNQKETLRIPSTGKGRGINGAQDQWTVGYGLRLTLSLDVSKNSLAWGRGIREAKMVQLQICFCGGKLPKSFVAEAF